MASFWKSLPSLLSRLAAPFKDFADLITNKADIENKGDGPPKEFPIIPSVMPSPPTDEETEQKCCETPWWKTLAEMIGIGTVIVYTVVSYNQWQTMKDSFFEAQKQTKIYQQQLESAARPWIKIVDVQTRGNGPVIPALSFQNAIGHQQATFQLKVSIKNIGHSVAEVTVRPDLYFPLWDGFGKSVPDEQKRFCDSDLGKARSGWYPSTILFPDESFDWYGAGAHFIDSSNTTHIENAAYVLPVVVVCVDYRLKSLPNAYQSSAVYEVFRKDNRTRFFEPGVGVPADRIFLIRDSMNDYAY
jgi:hypothetical protein